MASGTVKWYDEKKGYGFISKDDGGELFFHRSAIREAGYKKLEEGERVTFDIQQSDRGPKAIDIYRE
ncbi:MAG: cold-shock protein [Deltaproteobacteria bacterium]|nr:cold-shock protein [Deltaproteobacteria bacterium]MBW1960405.1 cold-shock protein [Deltaproteobacteria bacterium]MBW2153429.1 cold-shock protein [Deltaproteobacteria bacterium]